VIPVGGGSALAGAGLATQGRGVELIAAEPMAVPALSAALQAGRPVTVPAGATIADGLRPDRIGALPFALCHRTVSEVITVDEDAIGEALCLALVHARLLVEPAAATALAAAVQVADLRPGQLRDVGVLLSGGNVEAELVASLLARHTDRLTAAAV
jgi:threonine dehydratase